MLAHYEGADRAPDVEWLAGLRAERGLLGALL